MASDLNAHSPLPHRLAEAVVVIGADQYSGLNLFSGDSEGGRRQCSLNKSVFAAKYQPQVIATLTESRAYFPDKMISSPSSYPPPAFKRVTNRSGPTRRRQLPPSPSVEESMALNENLLSGSLFGSRRSSRRTSGMMGFCDEERIHRFACRRRRHSIDKRKSPNSAGPDGVIKAETIQGIPRFLYSDGLEVKAMECRQTRPPTTISYLSLTELNGGRLYATAINCHRVFRVVRREEDGRVRVRGVEEEELAEIEEKDHETRHKNKHEDEEEKEGPLAYVPYSILLISKHPYMTVMKECLSALINTIHQYENAFEQEVMHFAASMTHTPVPPPGIVTLEIFPFNCLVTIPPPLPIVNTVVDFDLTLLLNAFNHQDIILILVTLLTQQRLVVLSRSLSQTVIACETILLLMRPFRWLFPYVPSLPAFLLEFLDAPGPFFYGCNVRYIKEVREASCVVIANLETGEVEVPGDVNLPSPPQEACEKLCNLLAQVRMNFDIFQLDQPSFSSIDGYRRAKARFDAFNRQVVLLAFIELMVDFFRNLKQCLQFDSINKKNIFNYNMFINSQIESKEFFEAVCRCEIFTDFVRNRIAASDDDPWNFVEERTRFESRRTSSTLARRRSSFLLNVIEEIRIQDIKIPADNKIKEIEFKPLRLLDYSPTSNTNFIEANIVMLRHQIEQSKDDSSIAAFLRIKSELHLSLGQKYDCLRDMSELSRRDVGLLCKDHVRQLLANLTSQEIETMTQSGADIVSQMHKLVDDHSVTAASVGRRKSNVAPDLGDNYEVVDTCNRLETKLCLPDKSLNFDDFSSLLKNAVVTSDVHLHDSLFSVLTHGSEQPERFRQVDPMVFGLFYDCWKMAMSDIIEITSSACVIVHDSEVVKVSTPILIDQLGTGRLLLTRESLLLIKDGFPVQVRQVIDLRFISEIAPAAATLFSNRRKRSVVIKHTSTDISSPIVMYLHSEREMRLWTALLKEMWAGQIISAAKKDPTLVNQAMDNAILMDVLLRANSDPTFEPSMPYDTDTVIKQLGRLTIVHQANDFQLDAVTKPYLRKKFSVWAYEGERRSIGALAAQVARDGKVKLWCVCNEDGRHSKTSRLVILDGLSHVLESEVLAVSGELMCMLKVGDHMWVGDMNYKIYIVNIGRQKITRELVEHQHNDGVISLAASENNELVASGSVGGEVLVWQAKSGALLRRWNCSVRSGIIDLCFSPIHSTQVWCCLRSSIYVYDTNTGEEIHTFCLHSSTSMISTAPMFQCLTASKSRGKVYAAFGRSSHVVVFNGDDAKLERLIELDQRCRKVGQCSECPGEGVRCRRCRERSACHGVSCLAIINNSMWAACKDGNISISSLSADGGPATKQLHGHDDGIQAICVARVGEHNFVFTGARSEDGKIAHWHAFDDPSLGDSE